MAPYTSQEHAEKSQNSTAISAVLGICSMKYSIVKSDDDL